MTTTVYNWVHPQLRQWQDEDAAACAPAAEADQAYRAARDQIKALEAARDKYRYEHETEPDRQLRLMHEAKVADMDRDIREAYHALHQMDGNQLAMAMAMRKSQPERAAQEAAIRKELAALQKADQELRELDQWNARLDREADLHETKLAAIRLQKAMAAQAEEEVRRHVARDRHVARFPRPANR